MRTYPCVLTIAGSDCSGGAGIQADIKAISALGAYAASAITAITVQNTLGVTGIHPVPPAYVKGQIEAVMDDIRPKAVKIGMINDAEIVKVIAESILKYHPEYVVFDPVMVSTSGCKLMEDEAIEAIGQKISNVEDMKHQAKEMLKLGCKGVLIKGGHLDGGLMCDVLQTATEETPHLFTAPKVNSRNTHGTGCTLSSAIATFLALGEPMSVAVEKAKQYVYKGIESGKDVCIGGGHGPLNHFHSPVAMHIFDKNE